MAKMALPLIYMLYHPETKTRKYSDRYSIAVETDSRTTDGSDEKLKAIMDGVTGLGAERILKFYNKSTQDKVKVLQKIGSYPNVRCRVFRCWFHCLLNGLILDQPLNLPKYYPLHGGNISKHNRPSTKD
jgi:hypothetical protein